MQELIKLFEKIAVLSEMFDKFAKLDGNFSRNFKNIENCNDKFNINFDGLYKNILLSDHFNYSFLSVANSFYTADTLENIFSKVSDAVLRFGFNEMNYFVKNSNIFNTDNKIMNLMQENPSFFHFNSLINETEKSFSAGFKPFYAKEGSGDIKNQNVVSNEYFYNQKFETLNNEVNDNFDEFGVRLALALKEALSNRDRTKGY